MGEPQFLAIGLQTRIRIFTRRDVDRWQSWPRHEDPLYSIYNPAPMAGSVRDAWFDDVVHRQHQLPFAIEALDRQMIGRIFLRHVKRLERSSILGIDLDPRYVGRGYGTDALSTFLGYYFGAAGFGRVCLTVGAYNLRARRSYERCGFRCLGTHWDRLTCRADVLTDRRYADIRSLFRRGPSGLEALMYDMVEDACGVPPGASTGSRGNISTV